jgi:hypothetical protein
VRLADGRSQESPCSEFEEIRGSLIDKYRAVMGDSSVREGGLVATMIEVMAERYAEQHEAMRQMLDSTFLDSNIREIRELEARVASQVVVMPGTAKYGDLV